MDKNTVIYHFDQILEALNDRSSEYNGIQHEASDIEDLETSQALWSDAKNKRMKINGIKAEIEAVKKELLDESLLDQNPDNTDTPAKQVSQSEGELISNASDEHWLPLNFDFTGKKVKKFSFNNKVYHVQNYKDAYVKICELLYDYDRARFKQMVNEDHQSKKQIKLFTKDGNLINLNYKIKYYEKMNNSDLYVLINHNSKTKAKLITYMLNYFNLPSETVKLSVSDD